MKIVPLIIFGFLGMHALEAAASEPYGFAGCGAGTRIWGPRNMQTSASTTNHGTIPIANNLPIGLPTSQPWSITFDWAGCNESAQPVAYFDQYNYMFANFAAIAKEAAHGEGIILDGLADKFGCPHTNYSDFRAELKNNYDVIFSQPGIRATFLEMRDQVASSPLLSNICTEIAEPNSANIAQASNG